MAGSSCPNRFPTPSRTRACHAVVDGLPAAEVPRISTMSGPSPTISLVSREIICGGAALRGPLA